MNKMDTITVTMAGPSGVGKTSLLASMYSHIRDEAREHGCSFTASPAVINELVEREEELKDFAEGPGLRVSRDLGPKPSQDKRVFGFNLHFESGKVPDVPFEFIDLPGGWYASGGDFDEADRCVLASHVVVVAVDSWALMEAGGKYNNKINKPKQICEALQRASDKLRPKDPRPLILFVLVKAEKYLHDDQHDKLLTKAISVYRPLVDPLVKNGYPVVGCAVETVGGVELHRIIEENGRPIGEFLRVTGGYKPKHCAIPLRLIFEIALSGTGGRIRTDGDFFEHLLGFFGVETELKKNLKAHTELKEVAQKLSEKLKSEPLVWINKI